MEQRLRVATYNIHKCRGMDARTRPSRVAEVLHELEADVVALQEVVRGQQVDQAMLLAQSLGYAFAFGKTRDFRGGDYGNAVLSRLPIVKSEHIDLTASRREPRGCVRAELRLPGGAAVQLFNVHLGTGFLERRKQAHLLVEMLRRFEGRAPRLVLGDFNEWTRGLTTEMLSARLQAVKINKRIRRGKSYPGIAPVLHLDNIYFDPRFEPVEVRVHRTRKALMASDHLPIVAEFRLG